MLHFHLIFVMFVWVLQIVFYRNKKIRLSQVKFTGVSLFSGCHNLKRDMSCLYPALRRNKN